MDSAAARKGGAVPVCKEARYAAGAGKVTKAIGLLGADIGADGCAGVENQCRRVVPAVAQHRDNLCSGVFKADMDNVQRVANGRKITEHAPYLGTFRAELAPVISLKSGRQQEEDIF